MPIKKSSDERIEDTEHEGTGPKKAGRDAEVNPDSQKSAPSPADESTPGRRTGEADAPRVPEKAKPSFE